MPHGTRVTCPHIAHLQYQQKYKILTTQDLSQTPKSSEIMPTDSSYQRDLTLVSKDLHTTADEMLSCLTINSRTQSNQTLKFVQWGQYKSPIWIHTYLYVNLDNRPCLIVICKGNVTKGVQNLVTQTSTWQRRTNDIHSCGKKRLIITMVILQIYWKNVLCQSHWVYRTHTKQMQLVNCQPILVWHDCVTNERSEQESNITVASVTPWLHCDTSKPQCNRRVRCRHVTSVEISTLTTDVVIDECVADAFTLPLDGSCGGGGNDELLTPPKMGPTSGGPHMISWCHPLYFLHTTLHHFAICPGNKYQNTNL